MILTNMSRQKLDKWIENLSKAIRVEDNEGNKKLYHKWLDEAIAEKSRRYNAREFYLEHYKNT